MTMKKKALFPFLGIALLVGGCPEPETEDSEPVIRSIRSVVVASDDGSRSRSFAGSVRAGNQTRLSFQVPGRIDELGITVGATVSQGERIARVDPTDFELQIQEARASASQARAQARSAAATYDRIRALYASQNASRQDLDNARAQRDSAQAASAAVGQSIRRLQRQLEYATLTAPDDGTISEVMAERNEVVAAGQVIATLQVGEQLEVAVDVPESHINRVGQGDEVQVAIDSQDEPLAGTVYEVGVPTQGGTVFPVTIRLPEETTDVRAGMSADVTFLFELDEEEMARHVVPVTAVSEDGEGTFVYVAEGEGELGTVRRVSVEVGDISTNGIEIREGLEDGLRVVTAGVSRIHPGMEVRIPENEGSEGDAEETDADGADEGEAADEEAAE